MPDALFSAVELAGAETESAPGFRLSRVEVRNWGTFDGNVWSLDLGARNTLLTGDIGSGKSTLVDAITTLLVPAHRVSYNKAAGADNRERSLLSYVLGYYKSERNEATGTSRKVALRRPGAYSVVLGQFVNEGYDAVVTLAQVFWTREGHPGQPDRFYVVHPGALSIVPDFVDFGTEMPTLRRRLRSEGARVHDHFPDYGKELRRALGIESEQALELFHQTVSLKSVGDLNEFVREHMLEPFDSAAWIDRLVAHFEDLSRAHESVLRARGQIEALQPLLADLDECARLDAELVHLSAQQDAVDDVVDGRRALALRRLSSDLEREVAEHRSLLGPVERELARARDQQTRLEVERAGAGGDRVAELERQASDLEALSAERRRRADRFGQLLADAGLAAVSGAGQFEERQREVAKARRELDDTRAGLDARRTDAEVERRHLVQRGEALNAELLSLRSRTSNLPKRSLDLREWLCRELGLDEAELPFAGELIQVRADCVQWEGAAERVLHGFALSLLVPQSRYDAVSRWINDRHLGARLVYFRVPASLAADPIRAVPDSLVLADTLEVRDSPFSAWLERELRQRGGHVCATTVEEFQHASRAVTRQGQVKQPGGRHEKDDRRRVDDRSAYVLGWNNEAKVDALLSEAAGLQRLLDRVAAELEQVAGAACALDQQRDALTSLAGVSDWSEIDWSTLVREIATLDDERRRLESRTPRLAELAERLTEVVATIADLEDRVKREVSALGVATSRHEEARARLDQLAARLDSTEPIPAEVLQALSDRLASAGIATVTDNTETDDPVTDDPVTELAALDEAVGSIAADLRRALQERGVERGRHASAAERRMTAFRTAYPVETAEMDDSLLAEPAYRELATRLQRDDLPRFEAEFKTYLNTNAIRDIAGFQAQLTKQVDLVRARIDIINDSLVGIDYSPGRFIRLVHELTPNTEVRDFRRDLRACTDDSLAADQDDRYSEEKFRQVSALIERFRGRAGRTEQDAAWARRVTDVRNWLVFSASERSRADDTEHEHYSGSGGKSGGQKEKLAYTILAASLAYQFKLEFGARRSRTFRFVVIDEAFGRGSDESTRYALDLFTRLGLQLLIVTPLQKIHVIDPYVRAVGFVDNPSGNSSRLQSMTIEEYHERQRAHAAAGGALQVGITG
jgi:uncharacterized protein YPO0396